MPRVTLLTDFGTVDGYVAAMKGVLATRVPGVLLDDVSHDLAPGDVGAASRALEGYWSLYPAGSVHLVVVDPGVGSERKALALEVEGRFVVAPDNGVVTGLLGRPFRAVEVTAAEAPGGVVSATFHGRDLFAPAAAYLASGGALGILGPPLADPVRLARSAPERSADGTAHGRVVSVDRFGNLATDLPGDWLGPASIVEVGGRSVRVCRIYADGGEGEPIALVDSRARVEIAVRNDSAARILGMGPGAAVVLRD